MSDTTVIECFVHIVDDHCSNGLTAVRLLQQIASQRGGGYFRDVLMLADRGDLDLVETAKADAILHRNHGGHPTKARLSANSWEIKLFPGRPRRRMGPLV
jgi:hypothetical protein